MAVTGDSDEATTQLAHFIGRLTLDDVPAAAIENAKLAILDTFGVALAGSRSKAGRRLAEYVHGASPAGPAHVFGATWSTSPEHAALANGTMAHALDYDDRNHASTHVLATALALGEACSASGAQLLLAYVLGREVRLALDQALDNARYEGHGPGARGWHATGILGALGSAAAGTKLLGLGPEAVAHALGIAASLGSGLMANFGTMTKPLHAGNAARNGVLAATLAAAGFTAEPTILTAGKGLTDAICQPGEYDLAAMLDGLTSGFTLAREGVRIKPYPSCTGSHPYIDTVRRLRREYGLIADRIDYIECTSTGGLNRLYPRTPIECKFSAAYAIAVTIVAGTFEEQHCSMQFLAREDIKQLLAKTRYVGPAWADKRTTSLVIGLTSGERIDAKIEPMSDLTDKVDVHAKFYENSTPIIGRERAEQLESAIADLANHGPRELMAGLHP